MKSKKVRQYEEDFRDEHGYIYCEHCMRSQSFAFSVHHIIFKSQFPKHKELDNKLNLQMLCSVCHKFAHSKKDFNANLIKERKLYDLFN